MNIYYVLIVILLLFIFYIIKVKKQVKIYDWSSLSENSEDEKIVKRYLEYLKSADALKDRKLNRAHLTIFLIAIIAAVCYSFYLWTEWFELANSDIDSEFAKPVFCTTLTAVLTGLYYKLYSKLLK